VISEIIEKDSCVDTDGIPSQSLAQVYGAKIFTAKEVHNEGHERILDLIQEGAECLVTIDCDGLDPSIMPAVKAPVPGGLLFQQGIDLIHHISKKANVKGFNLIEFVPEKDVNGFGCLDCCPYYF
jgi:agmatinase